MTTAKISCDPFIFIICMIGRFEGFGIHDVVFRRIRGGDLFLCRSRRVCGARAADGDVVVMVVVGEGEKERSKRTDLLLVALAHMLA